MVNETLINIIMMNKLALFLIIAGISGLVFNRLYIIQALISFEVILLGLNYLIILYAIQYKLLSNQIPSLLLLAVAAA
jgi:NADH:ubiquinone oxidoreductase subunit K